MSKANTKKIIPCHLQEVFNPLNQYNMKLNASKYIFGVTSTKFLSHMIISKGIEADPAKIKAVADIPAIKSKKHIKKLNGMIVALNRFITKVND